MNYATCATDCVNRNIMIVTVVGIVVVDIVVVVA